MREIRWQFVAEPLLDGWKLDLGSAAIRWFSAGPVSHVDSIVPEEIGWGRPGWLYGARSDRRCGIPPGVQLRPPGYAPFSWCCVATIPVTDDQWVNFWIAERAKFGLPYDRTAIWGFAADRDWREADSWFCSEMVADSAERAGIFPQKLFAPSNKVTPVALATVVSALPGVTFEVM